PAGQAVGRFIATVRPDQGTVTFVPADTAGQAHTKLHGFGPPDALRLVSSNVKQSTGVLSGDVKIVSSHPLPMYDVKIVIDQISSSNVTVSNADGTLVPPGSASGTPAKPYFSYNTVNAGATTATKSWKFRNTA